jgi:UDP:flavonoid glycosyltransferase YjiC (YdhE family)
VRILFASTRGGGHLGPLIPLARASVRAGHEVVVAAPSSLARGIARAGLRHEPVGAAPDAEVARAFAPVWAREASAAHVIGDLFAGMHARAVLPDMLALVAAWKPDVVVRETMEFASTLAAERHGVPQVRIGVHLQAAVDGNAGPLGIAAGALDGLRPLAGLAPDPELRAVRGSPLLTLAPAATDVPGAPAVRRFHDPEAIGPAARNGHGRPPLVYVAFGSEAPASAHFPAVYRATLDVLAPLDACVLVAIGDRRDPAELGRAPANAHVERWVPQRDVMREAAVMVSHGGSGSTLTALAAGVPQALVPLFVDGPANAARVAELGAGVALDGPAAIADALLPAVQRLLGDPAHRAAARAVADEIAALPPIDDAVALLQSL